jgi:hypothetical protein
MFCLHFAKDLTSANLSKVALKTFVDDISILAVERCLLKRVPELLSPKTIVSLDDTQISSIAAETEDSRSERTQTTRKLEVLTNAHLTLRKLYRSGASGMSQRVTVMLRKSYSN